MNPTQTRPLPNAADKAALKAIATTVIQTCPGLQDTAHEVASDLLKKYGIVGLDPDRVYFHRFTAAQSSSKTFTGWEHVDDTPTSSMSLTQLVIHRFRATDQDNADLLDLYAGFYSVGPNAGTFDETNEVRLHGNEVLKDFWSIDFSSLYHQRLSAFWNSASSDFRTLAKCNFLINAVQARDKRQLSDDDFNLVVNAVTGPITWPISLQQLQSEHPDTQGRVRTLDVDGYVATNILRIVAPKGRQIVYLPGETNAFQVQETATDMHFWMFQRMNTEDARQAFMTHFSLADRQTIAENITDIMNRLVSTWGKYDHHMINQKNQVIHGDAFSWLRDSSKEATFAEAELSLTSNGDLRKKLWIGYLSAGVKVFGPMAVVGWPVALPVVGASIANMGLNIDQAVNAKTAEERKAGILGAVLSGIDMLFNLLFIKGPGPLTEVGAQVDAAEASEMAELIETTQPAESATSTQGEWPTVDAQVDDEIDPRKIQTLEPTEVPAPMPDLPAPTSTSNVPDTYKLAYLPGDDSLVREAGRYQGIHRLASNPSTAITINDSAYYVRFENDVNGRGTWAIVDPANPYAFSGSIPVRLSAEGQWIAMPRLGLKGGMEASTTVGSSVAAESDVEAWASSPGTYVKELKTPGMKEWALGGPDEVVVTRNAAGVEVRTSRFAKRQRFSRDRLIVDAERYYAAHPSPSRPRIASPNPINTQTELLETAFTKKPGLVIGETRGAIGSKQFLIDNMPSLAKRGVKTLYLQELLTNANQVDLDTFARTSEMPEALENYLKKLDTVAGNDPEGRYNVLALVKTANAQRIRVQAIDCAITYNINGHASLEPQEQMARSFFASEVIQLNETARGPGNWVALVNRENMSAFRGFEGISEQTDALSLRIDDVAPQLAQPIAADPGIAVEYAAYPDSPVYDLEPGSGELDSQQELIRADWRLSVGTPWVYRTDGELDRLLTDPGMYTFQRSDNIVRLIYRDANKRITEIPIKLMSDGRLDLETPLWPDFKLEPFDNLQTLKRTLATKGMTLTGWSELKSTDQLTTDLGGEASGAATLSETLTPALPEIELPPSVPDNWQANELLEGLTPVSEPGNYEGIYRLDSDPSTAIMMNDTAYYVRFEGDINGEGHWMIINPEFPNRFPGSIPVRLNAEGHWETMPRSGLMGGGTTPGLPGNSAQPHVRLPDSPYDVPRRLRTELKTGADGHEPYALRDEYDSLNRFDPHREFKAIRKRLYQDAVRFYENPDLPPRPPIPQLDLTASAEDIIDGTLEHARGLVIGESHSAIGSKQFLIDNMELLARKNVKTLYMEHLLTDFHQAALDTYAETHVMPTDLERYLKGLDIGHMTDPLGRYSFLELVKEAGKHRIRVQAIDSMASYRVEGMTIFRDQRLVTDATARQKMMNYFARTIIRTDQAARGVHKWVALMGNTHSNTYEGIAGVSELEEAIGLRVEDIAEGAGAGVEFDPGELVSLDHKPASPTMLLKGDLRLRVETPWTAQTLPEIDALLSRAGTYTLKQEPRGLCLEHRSRLNQLVHTLIQSDGHSYYIHRPKWDSVSDIRYSTIKELLQALNDMGLKLGGWSKPL